MPERDQVSWNVIVAAFARAGDIDRMLGLLDAMERQGIYPNRLTFVALLDAFDRSEMDPSRFSDEGELLHSKISQHGFHFDLQIQTSLIKMYDRLGSVEKAIAVFDRISSPDAIAWNSLLSAFARNGDLDAANALFQRMPERSLVSWNIAIAANLHCGRAKTALWLLQVMDLDGGDTADRAIFITALYACGVLEKLRLGEAIHAEIAAFGLETDVCIGTALISMYGKCHRALLARDAFDRIKEKNQNVVLWSATIGIYAHNGLFDAAMELFFRMCLEGVHPNDVTFVNILSASAHAGDLSNARQWFFSVATDFGVAYTRDHYVCMADMLARSGLMDQARELVGDMPFVPDSCSWKTVLAGCLVAGSLKQAERVACSVIECEPEDSSPYIMLSNIYSAAKDQILVC
ncbi:hypothetical protein SELMODRAFT_77254 [Selaginella moellendorffii]|uniref:Pentacotripeptide-repeat region of PRORP domain-containing protein n=1 Tax=Selaginella moellendorffii TaxID=88036 RepID=D8QS50_SELML|nr:hypothetical protein SELMODRAFT_77254 [Selaginella moellendorffii]